MLRTIILSSALLSLVGCVNYADMHANSSLIQPTDLHTSMPQTARISWPADNWWTKFNDPQLNNLIQQALADSPTLKLAEARLHARQQIVSQATSSLYPEINANGSITSQSLSQTSVTPAGAIPTNFKLADLGLIFKYDFDWWGKNQATLASALSEVQAATADQAQARLILTTGITQSYFQTIIDKMRTTLAELNVKLQNEYLQLIKAQKQQGIASDLDLQQAQSNAASAKIYLEKSQQNYAISLHQLAALLGKNPEAPITISAALSHYTFNLPKVLPANLLARRPDITALRWRVESASHNIKIAKTQFFPNINLVANYGFETISLSKLLTQPSSFWSVGPAFNLPIFNAGALRANLGIQYANYDAAIEQYNQQIITAMRQTSDQVSILKSAEQQRLTQRNNLQAAQKTYELTLLRYRNGLDNKLATLQAQSALLVQRDLQLQLSLQHTLAVVNLIKAIGGGY